jgi:prevent-host-death family protein
MKPGVRFSEDVVPLGDLKVNPGKVVRQVEESGRPVLLTNHGP